MVFLFSSSSVGRELLAVPIHSRGQLTVWLELSAELRLEPACSVLSVRRKNRLLDAPVSNT